MAEVKGTQVKARQHRSLGLTPPAYRKGKRVKPRLRLLAYAFALITLAVIISTGLTVVFALVQIGPQQGGNRIIWSVAFVAIPPAFGYATMFALRALAIGVGWMSRQEAKSNPFHGHWPESWMEPLDDYDE